MRRLFRKESDGRWGGGVGFDVMTEWFRLYDRIGYLHVGRVRWHYY